MDFYAILDQVVDLLRSRQRATYRTLKRQFNLDDAALEDLKEELLFTYPQIVDEDGRGLVWTGEPDSASVTPVPAPSNTVSEMHQAREPLSYTPQHLAEKILTSRSVLEGERKQVTVLFADLKGSTELIADLDPEAAQQLLDPALHHMMEAVHRYEGTVNQVLGGPGYAGRAAVLWRRGPPLTWPGDAHACRPEFRRGGGADHQQ
jgi:hypothetical protein